jgi:hypothetical protein
LKRTWVFHLIVSVPTFNSPGGALFQIGPHSHAIGARQRSLLD